MISGLLFTAFFLAAENYEPHDWWGIAGLMVTNAGGIFGAIASVIGAVILYRQRGVKSAVEATQASAAAANRQVSNNHGDRMLRDDVDEVIRSQGRVLSAVVGMGESIGHIRDDMGQIRAALGDEERRRKERDEEQSGEISTINARLDTLDPSGETS